MENQCIFYNDNNVVITLPKNNDTLTVFSHAYPNRCNSEKLFRRLISFMINNHIIDKNKNFIDLGAWIGDNALPWSKNINGDVYAIDPSPSNCSYIKLLAELNNAQNVKVIQHAISDDKKAISTNENLEHCTFNEGGTGNTVIESTTLDTLFTEGEISNIGFIHLDVESMEFNVVKGAEKVLQDCRPIITFEQHLNTDNYQELILHLHQKGYKSFLINELLAGCRDDCRNFLAIPEEQMTEQLFHNLNKYVKNDDVFSAMQPYHQVILPINLAPKS